MIIEYCFYFKESQFLYTISLDVLILHLNKQMEKIFCSLSNL